MAVERNDGPVAQFNLLKEVCTATWATSLDKGVSAIIIGRYYPKFGGARASLRFLEEGTGATRPNIIASTRRLVSHGAFSIKVEGKGTRPTEYTPNFGFSASGIAGDTSASGIAHDTSCGIAGDTSTGSSGIADDTKTYLHVPAYNAGIHEGRNEFEAAPTAPPADGLGATAAETASGDGFAEFWKAWPRKHGKKKAEAEWKKIEHDVDVIIDVAREWAKHYAEHGVDKKWIPEPANWLKGERWDEDLPLIHIDAKGAAIAKAKANAPAKKPEPDPANDNAPTEDDVPAFMRGSPSLWPLGDFYGEFIENDVINEYGDKDIAAEMVFLVNTPGEHFGKRLLHRFYVQCFIQSAQDEGQKYLSQIQNAVGVTSVEDLDDLMFKPLRVRSFGKALTYSPIKEAA